MADLLNRPGVDTPTQVKKQEIPYKTKVDVQNWANKATGKPQIDLSIPEEEQGVYDFMDRYYPNYDKDLYQSAHGYDDFLNNETSNYSGRISDFHKTHQDTLRNELRRLHPEWSEEELNQNATNMYLKWASAKEIGSTPAKMKEYSIKDRERSNQQMHDDMQNARKYLANSKSYGTPESRAKHMKDYYEQEHKDAMERANDFRNIQKTVKNAGQNNEMENFTNSLNDYMTKNPKGRDDIPVTTRR